MAASERIGGLTGYEPVDEQRRAAFLRWFARRRVEARNNLANFFEFVIKEETSRARLHIAPHQRVAFKFVQRYPRCVLRQPVGTSKTYSMTALGLFELGLEPTSRGAVISASQDQAKKPLLMMRDYIEGSPELRAVFPKLRPSPREGDPWTQTKITIDRPAGIRDPSVFAIGLDGKGLTGSRLKWVVVDDSLDEKNTATLDQRKKVRATFFKVITSRMDVSRARIVVCNTPWVEPGGGDVGDLTYALQHAGWPTLEMDITGNIRFYNADDFDCDDIRPSELDSTGENHRLTAHDHPRFNPELAHLPWSDDESRNAEIVAGLPEHQQTFIDHDDEAMLWPEHGMDKEFVEYKRDVEYRDDPTSFNQLYMMRCRSQADSRVKVEWVDQCKAQAAEAGIYTLTGTWDKGFAVTGMDLGHRQNKKSDRTALFTFAVMPDLKRRVLDVQAGRWRSGEMIRRLIDVHKRYESIVRVENNGAQQFLIDEIRRHHADVSMAVRSHETLGKNKRHPRFGVESLFGELENELWMLPSDPSGIVPRAMQEAIDELFDYDPSKHTGDILMAWWLAREQARSSGYFLPSTHGAQQGGSALLSITAR